MSFGHVLSKGRFLRLIVTLYLLWSSLNFIGGLFVFALLNSIVYMILRLVEK